MGATALTLTAGSESAGVACEVSSQRTIEWTVRAAEGGARERGALSLALVLDRSGSMGGEKLRAVQRAAEHVLDLLDQRDRVAIVAYDDHVTVLSQGEAVTPQARDALRRQVGRLEPGGWTDLAGGWLEGCRAVAGSAGAGAIGRALLLTDGLANRGITDPEQIWAHARELRRRGVATSTFGVGLDFNEHLLEQMATEGGGHFYYIERADQIPDVFRRELGELLTVVAREAILRIAVPRGVAVEVLGELAHERAGDEIRIYLGDMYAGEERRLYARVLTPPDAPGTALAIRGELEYADLDGRSARDAAEVRFAYAREAEVRMLRVDGELLGRAAAVELAGAATRALKLEREGQRAAAGSVMAQAIAASAPHMPAAAAAPYQALQGQIEGGLSEEQRKESQFAAYRARHSRK